MSLSLDTVKRLMESLTSQPAGKEVADAVNAAQSLSAQSGWSVAAAIVAAHTSTTTDFGALKVGDLVVHIPAVAGSADFAAVITAGTNPDGAAVVGDLYVALRAFSAPAKSTAKL